MQLKMVGNMVATLFWAGVAMNLGMTNPTVALVAAGGYAELTKYNAAPGGGAITVFSL